jgi:trimethylamine:corrinoid methyltransferase-like protein
VERAREKVNEILEGPRPPALDEKVKKKLTSIIDEFEQKTG